MKDEVKPDSIINIENRTPQEVFAIMSAELKQVRERVAKLLERFAGGIKTGVRWKHIP